MSISYSSRGVPVTRGKRCIVQREKFLSGGRISKAFTPYDSPWVRSWLWIFALRHWKKKRKRRRIEGKEEEERGGENDPRTEENCVGTTTMRFSFPTEWKNIHLFYSRLWRLTKRGLRKTRQLWSMRKRGWKSASWIPVVLGMSRPSLFIMMDGGGGGPPVYASTAHSFWRF